MTRVKCPSPPLDDTLGMIALIFQINHPRYNQRRVSCVKYLGELYNYRMVESAVVFKTLYSFITFGVAGPGKLRHLLSFSMHHCKVNCQHTVTKIGLLKYSCAFENILYIRTCSNSLNLYHLTFERTV